MFLRLLTKRKEEEVVGGELIDERSRKGGRRDHLLLEPVIGAAAFECLLFADSVSSREDPNVEYRIRVRYILLVNGSNKGFLH
ncbi:hypothetical protein OPV22_006036 [Ensete ventricosum]|uniref:Uncharacterized protein n=1 Tax=Ensete ventricosum TaxID=4639 RepID=A0AAV8RE66_ENSVE|nr:hypothetical protein OPV22_006036 [Ensete ventricosum]